MAVGSYIDGAGRDWSLIESLGMGAQPARHANMAPIGMNMPVPANGRPAALGIGCAGGLNGSRALTTVGVLVYEVGVVWAASVARRVEAFFVL